MVQKTALAHAIISLCGVQASQAVDLQEDGLMCADTLDH